MDNELRIDAGLKGAQLKGDWKLDGEGRVIAEPELVITLSAPISDIDPVKVMAFCGMAKRQPGTVSVTLTTAQLAMNFDRQREAVTV